MLFSITIQPSVVTCLRVILMSCILQMPIMLTEDFTVSMEEPARAMATAIGTTAAQQEVLRQTIWQPLNPIS